MIERIIKEINGVNAVKMKKALIVTGYKCNNNCLFCSVGDRDRAFNRPYADIANDLEAGRDSGCNASEFIGGEATIRKDIARIVEKARGMGYEFVSLETNGRMFSSMEFAKKMAKAGLTHLLFSLHSHEAETHDKITCAPGSFEQAVKGIRHAQSLGNIVISSNFVANKLNCHGIREYLEFISQFDVSAVHISFVNPSGSALKNSGEVVPKISEVAACIGRAVKGFPELNIRVQNIPPCLASGFRDMIVRTSEKEKCLISSESKKRASLSKELDKLKEKPKSCSGCRMADECDGVWKGYLGLHGGAELKPAQEEVASNE